jgi:predicted DNA repair protein MutK
MFLVGGGIVAHGIAPLHHWQVALEQALTQPWSLIASLLYTGLVGVVLGAAIVGVVELAKRLRQAWSQSKN